MYKISKLIFFFVFAVGQVFGQRVDIDKVKFETQYTQLPIKKIDSNIKTYTTQVILSKTINDVFNPEEIQNKIKISGYQKLSSDQTSIKVIINFGDITITRNEVVSSTKESKGTNGIVTKTISYQHVLSTH